MPVEANGEDSFSGEPMNKNVPAETVLWGRGSSLELRMQVGSRRVTVKMRLEGTTVVHPPSRDRFRYLLYTECLKDAWSGLCNICSPLSSSALVLSSQAGPVLRVGCSHPVPDASLGLIPSVTVLRGKTFRK